MFVIYAVASTFIVRILYCENTTILERACIEVDLKNICVPAMVCCKLINYEMDVHYLSTVSYHLLLKNSWHDVCICPGQELFK